MFGSISTGTLRTEDLLDAFSYELEYQIKKNHDVGDYSALLKDAESVDPESDDASEIVGELADALNDFAPDYGYFGAHTGDGADFGFWLCDDFQQRMADDGVLQVSGHEEYPENYTGAILVVNDHGNADYGYVDNGKYREIWSVV